MSLITLPPDVSSLLARWQAAHDMTDITNQLVVETRALLTALTTLPDQRTQLTNLTEQVRQLTDNAEIAETTIRTLRDELAAARATVNVLTRAAEAVLTEPRITTEREEIPDPENFDGTPSKLLNFLMQLELKAASYSNEQTKLRLAVNYLRGDAADQVRSYVRNGRVNLPNLAALITILENAFSNPNRVAEAESKLSTIQQGARDFPSYYAEFQRYASEVTWDEQSKLAALKRGLAFRLNQDMIPVCPKPATLTEFVDLSNDMDTARRQIQKESPRPGPSSTAPQSTAPPPQVTTATGSSPSPMDLSTNRRRITPEEKARRMAEGRCYRCGGLGHIVRDCPLGQRTLQAAAVAPIITPNAEQSEN